MEWKNVGSVIYRRQCEYRGYTIIDTVYGFVIYRPNETIKGITWSVDDAIEWIDNER